MKGAISRAALLCFATLSAANELDLAKRKSSSSNNLRRDSASITIPSSAAAAGQQLYQRDECWDSNLNPYTVQSGSKKWIQINQNTTVDEGQNNLNSAHDHVNWYFDIYDAYYNGSFSIKLEAPAGTNSSVCQDINSPTIPNVFFRIGQVSRSGGQYSRTDYDKNKYYFRFGRATSTASDNACGLTPKKLFTSLESSNDQLDNNDVWQLDATKSGDQFEISGKITTDLASYNNYFNYLTANSINTADECPDHFQIFALTAQNNASMTGTVSESQAQISWSFTDVVTKWKISGNFTGTPWSGGAKLDTSGTQPQTTGEAKRVESASSVVESFWESKGKIVVGVVVGIGALILLLIGALVFCCCRKRKVKTQYKQAGMVDDDRDWAMDDDRKGLVSGTPMGHLDPRAPSPAPQTQGLLHNVDTSYQPHMPPVSPGLPAYTDHPQVPRPTY